jgi:hypothetical protein
VGGPLARKIGGVLAAACAATLALSTLTADGGPLDQVRHSASGASHGRPAADRPQGNPRTPPRPPRPDVAGTVRHRVGVVEAFVGRVWRAARRVLGAVAAVLLGLLVTRTQSRHKRRYRRHRLVAYRAEEAPPDQVRRLIESWHQMTLRRWWQRLVFGQPSLCLEVRAIKDEAGLRVRLLVAIPDVPGATEAFDGRLASCFRDSRLAPEADPVRPTRSPPGSEQATILRLKKRRPFTTRLATPERLDPSLVDALAATMATGSEPVVFQLALTPTPASFDRFARWLFRSEERQLESARVGAEGADPGIRSEVAQQELEGGLEVQHRPLFFADLRVAAPTYATAARVAGIVRGESGAENRLVERRTILRRDLYLARISQTLANPLPSWSRGVLSSSEVTGLWHLPSPFLKGVRVEHSSLPRVPAPPEVGRADENCALLRDELGAVAITDADKRMNAMLLGTQGTGKTSVMCRGIAADAADPDCAVIVLDGKSDLATKALSVIPPDIGDGRKVHYLDFAHPEIGIDPFTADADRDAVADGIVEAFKDIHEDGSIQASSDRYLRQAALACMGWAEKTGQGRATLWDMWTLLLPSADDFRKEVVAAIAGEPELAAPAMFFGEQLPDQLRAARGQFAPRLDSPVNKLQKLAGQPKLDTILRHPLSLSIDEVIENRDVLVISGAVGTFGEGSARVLLQFILHMVHRALTRQQQLPEADRARVALKVDEAHLLFSRTFARMLAMDRSAGLECVAAWQSLGQIEDRELRSVILNLLRHRLIFSLADDDAREMTSMLQTAYTDMVRDDQQARARMRITPDALMNLPNFHCACSWIVDGARVPSFVATTIPMVEDTDRIAAHIEAQRERGGHYPGPIPKPERSGEVGKVRDFVPRTANGADPQAKPDAQSERDASTRADESKGETSHARPQEATAPDGAAAEAGHEAPATEVPDFRPEASSFDDRADRVGIAPLGMPTGSPVAETYTELVIDSPTGVRWEQPPPGPHKPPLPRRDDLEVLAALHELRFLLASQIRRQYMTGRALRSVQHRLGLMWKVGWVSRCEIARRQKGHTQRVYALAEAGHQLLLQNAGRTELTRNVERDSDWRAPEAEDPRLILHDIHAAGWLFALENHLRDGVITDWRGPRSARLDPPGERVRGQWVPMTPETVPLGTGRHLTGLALGEFRPVKPDLRIELNLSFEGSPARRIDLLVEMDRTGRPSSNLEKFRRYDAMLAGWSMHHSRYKRLGEPPVVVFVVEDEEKARGFLAAADKLVTGRVGGWGSPEASWSHHGRQRIFVVCERDLHQRTLRALRLPELPPELRSQNRRKKAARLEPEQVPSLVSAAFVKR